MYMLGYKCPDIYYAVNYCAQYMFAPNYLHDLALKRIGSYLKATMKKGLYLNPF